MARRRKSGPAGDPLAEAVRGLRSPEVEARREAANALWFGLEGRDEDEPVGADVVPALALALGDADEEVRYGAAHALGVLEERAEPALPALVAALGDPSDEVGEIVAETLARFGAAA